MSEPTLTCPKCGTEIKLTESLAAPMVAAVEEKYQAQLAQKDRDIEARETSLREDAAKLKASVREDATRLKVEREAFDETVQEKVQEGQTRIRAEEKRRLQFAMEEQEKELAAKDEKLAEAQKEQANLLRKQRELDEEKRELDLTVEKKIQDGLSAAREKAQKDAEDLMGLRVREKEETINSMARQIEDLRRKAEQGSQQLQGEVQELQLEENIKAQFPDDIVEPVPKGVHGGDIMHSVVSDSGVPAGVILWESKRTKTWSNTWLPKLRDDQRAAKADVAVLVSTTLPKDMDTLFNIIDGVWVCGPDVALALAAVMRDGLLRVSNARAINRGMATKAEEVYQYLTGAQFKRRVEAIVEAFSTMKEDLDKERKAITKQWVKRETQIERVMQATIGMYGDLSAIAGKSLGEIDDLDMKLLGGPDDKGDANTRI